MEIPKKTLEDFDYKAYFFYQRVAINEQDEKLIEAEKKAFMRGLKLGYEIGKIGSQKNNNSITTKFNQMKKFLFLFASIIFCFSAFSQVTVTIDNVTAGKSGKFNGDYVTFTVSAPNNELWGITVQSVYDGHNGHVGIWNPNAGSFTTTTYTVFVGYSGKLPSVRTYKGQILFRPNADHPTPEDADAVVYSDPFTITK